MVRRNWCETRPFSFGRLLGDVNGDGVVNGVDISLIRRNLGAKRASPPGDVNGDGVVTTTDLNLARRTRGRSIPIPGR